MMCFEANFRCFEKELRKARGLDARKRRQTCPTCIFKDVKRETLERVETLIEGPEARVSRLDEEEMALEVAGSHEWDPSTPVLVDGIPCPVIHAEPDKLWLEGIPASDPPECVSQPALLGSVPAVFRAFGGEWSKRWLET